MPTIVACFKWVVDEAYIRKGSDGKLDFSSVDYKIGEYDRNAIEEAARLRDTGGGGSVIGITVGAPESAKGVKDGLSRGMDQAFFVSDPSFKDLEPSQTAAILAEVIRHAHPAIRPHHLRRGVERPLRPAGRAEACRASRDPLRLLCPEALPRRRKARGRSACRGRHRGCRGAAPCPGDGSSRHQHAADSRCEGHADGRQETRHDDQRGKSLRAASKGC